MSHLYPEQKATEKEIKVKAPKVPKPAKKRSEKMKKIVAELKKLYPLFLLKHRGCQIKGPDCTRIATVVHHTEGRLPSKILDQSKWMASCAICNMWVEQADGEARKKGIKKSKF